MNAILRQHAEDQFAHELAALQEIDQYQRPPNWVLSPRSVVKYIFGDSISPDITIEPKYYGERHLIEQAIATLATDRALLLTGVPGTGKTWLSEHLAAAISGDSSLLVQGTAGTPEETIRYGWNYARLIAEGPSEQALIPSPMMIAMQKGHISRIEELTRIPSDVQDTLITILSEKVLPIPELNSEVQALKGFNVIATANTRDKGVNDLSSALKRRFNVVSLPLPKDIDQEIEIVRNRVESLGRALELPTLPTAVSEIRRVVTIFRELRSGITEDGKRKVNSPSSTLSTAEAISVINTGASLATHFGNGVISARDIASSLVGAIIKDPIQDQTIWLEYLENVVKHRQDWSDLYDACREISG